MEDPEYAVTQLAQTTMRSELGKLSLDKVFRVRGSEPELGFEDIGLALFSPFWGSRSILNSSQLRPLMTSFTPLFLQERESLNANIVDAINQAADCWGIRCLRYEIKDIHVPPRVKESMQMQVGPREDFPCSTCMGTWIPFPVAMGTVAGLYKSFTLIGVAGGFQVEAERRKRATVLESEGTRESAINVAEGKKQAQILASEAEKAEQINQAAGQQRVEPEGRAGHGSLRVGSGTGA